MTACNEPTKARRLRIAVPSLNLTPFARKLQAQAPAKPTRSELVKLFADRLNSDTRPTQAPSS